MDVQVLDAIKAYQTYQMNDKSALSLQPVPLPSKCWKTLGLDIVGPDMAACPIMRFAAIASIDYYSKRPEVAFA